MYHEHAVIAKNFDDIILDWNAGACQLFGYEKPEMLGQACAVLFPPETHANYRDTLDRLSRGEVVCVPDGVLIHRDGRRIDVSLTESPLSGPAGNLVVVVAHQLTAAKPPVTPDTHAPGMKEVRRSINSVVHRLNNFLTVVLNNADLLTTQFWLEDAGQPHLGDIRSAAKAIEALTQDILELGRPRLHPFADVIHRPAPALDGPYGHETVLLVEDHDTVRNLARHTLEERGYTVLEAGDGEAALCILHQLNKSIDLVVSDLRMPNLDGLQLADRVSALYPTIKIILTSGFPDGINECLFLQKPFSPASLAQKVRDILDGPIILWHPKPVHDRADRSPLPNS